MNEFFRDHKRLLVVLQVLGYEIEQTYPGVIARHRVVPAWLYHNVLWKPYRNGCRFALVSHALPTRYMKKETTVIAALLKLHKEGG